MTLILYVVYCCCSVVRW